MVKLRCDHFTILLEGEEKKEGGRICGMPLFSYHQRAERERASER